MDPFQLAAPRITIISGTMLMPCTIMLAAVRGMAAASACDRAPHCYEESHCPEPDWDGSIVDHSGPRNTPSRRKDGAVRVAMKKGSHSAVVMIKKTTRISHRIGRSNRSNHCPPGAPEVRGHVSFSHSSSSV